MTFTYTRFLSRLSTPVLKKHSRKFTHLYPGTPNLTPLNGILRRCFCEKPVDLYAAINEDDFEIYDQTSNYKDVDFESIANGDLETMKNLKRIQLEIDIFAQEGGQVPNSISSENWLELLSYRSKSQRMKHLRFLWLNESKKLNKKLKQALYRNELETFKISKAARTDFSTNSPMEYGLLRNTLFHRFYDPDMKNLYNWRLLQAEMLGPHIIIDCGYDEYMNVFDISKCTKDMLKSWSANREHFYPFDMIFCNLKQNSNSLARLCSVLPAIERDPMCPFNYTDKHYLDLFPKEKLVYLTSHCTEEMKSFEGDSIYIIGGVVDRSQDMALSLAKAKKEGLRKMKLPLDRYLKWNFGKKTLSIAECVSIMNDLKDGCSWDFALRHVRHRQMPRTDIFSDGEVLQTSTKHATHFEELDRRKNIYNMLLKKKAKKR